MKIKLTIFTIVFILLSTYQFQATTLISDNESIAASGDVICANASYYYQGDETKDYQALIYNQNGVYLSFTNSTNGVIEFVFPENATAIAIDIYQITNNSKTYIETMDFTVEACGYDQVTDEPATEYPNNTVNFTSTLEGDKMTVTAPELDNYKLLYNVIEENDNGLFTQLEFIEGKAEITLDSDVVQFEEEYTNTEGKTYTKYYEYNTQPVPRFRILTNLNVTVINPVDYIDKSIIMRLLYGLIALVILLIIKIIFSRKYKKKKLYNQKIRAIKEGKANYRDLFGEDAPTRRSEVGNKKKKNPKEKTETEAKTINQVKVDKAPTKRPTKESKATAKPELKVTSEDKTKLEVKSNHKDIPDLEIRK